jgi:peptidoglycan/xylan/chitin deacetylase (PgdA/CDA1 family)
MLSWDQVREMSASGVAFGGHTVTHPFLSRLDPAHALDEVLESRRRIEQETQAAVAHFAYPNGRPADIAPWTHDVLRQAGYTAAVTTIWGMNTATTDVMSLRRGGPWEQHPALFALKFDFYQLLNS